MNDFAESMRSLREAVDHGHNVRDKMQSDLRKFKCDLSENVTQLRQALRSDYSEMTQRLRANNLNMMKALGESVHDLKLASYYAHQARHRARQVCIEQRLARRRSVKAMQQHVLSVRQDLIADRAQARCIWSSR